MTLVMCIGEYGSYVSLPGVCGNVVSDSKASVITVLYVYTKAQGVPTEIWCVTELEPHISEQFHNKVCDQDEKRDNLCKSKTLFDYTKGAAPFNPVFQFNLKGVGRFLF